MPGTALRFQLLRVALGLNKRQFAQAIGIQRTHIHRMEWGTEGIGRKRILRICDRLRIPLMFFLLDPIHLPPCGQILAHFVLLPRDKQQAVLRWAQQRASGR